MKIKTKWALIISPLMVGISFGGSWLVVNAVLHLIRFKSQMEFSDLIKECVAVALVAALFAQSFNGFVGFIRHMIRIYRFKTGKPVIPTHNKCE